MEPGGLYNYYSVARGSSFAPSSAQCISSSTGTAYNIMLQEKQAEQRNILARRTPKSTQHTPDDWIMDNEWKTGKNRNKRKFDDEDDFMTPVKISKVHDNLKLIQKKPDTKLLGEIQQMLDERKITSLNDGHRSQVINFKCK